MKPTARSVLALSLLSSLACGGSTNSPITVLDDAAVLDTSVPNVDAAIPSDTSVSSDATPDSSTASVADPSSDGPFAIAERDGAMNVSSTGDNNLALHIAYPTNAGTYPVVVIAHGFQLPPSQYYGYAKRLASFGYVAMTVDYPASAFGMNNPNQAKDLLAAIDWAKLDSKLGPIADTNDVGMSGHSLGGKLALLASTMDSRVKASFALDPVDGGAQGCAMPNCVNVAPLMGALKIPTGFIGETTDGMSNFQACAPSALNYMTFYAQTQSPSLAVTAIGANHMSFLDDVSKCGFVCGFCNKPTVTNGQVNGMARAFMVAFYERYLRGNVAYDAYLTGSQAQSRYVSTQQATLLAK